jgi:tetratricopeptide (TPR) repeat protein
VLSICFFSRPVFADDPREKHRVVAEKCKAAMESYYRGDYSAAIRNWEDALKADPDQAAPRRMIEESRKKIEERLGPLEQETHKHVAEGRYDDALRKNSELLTLDPTNPQHRSAASKLARVAAVSKNITGGTTSADALRRSVENYIYREENIRHSIIGARRAVYLDPSDASAKKLKEMFEREYPHVAQFEKEMPGVDILESKLMSALDNIYDGRYDKAIADCNDALFLDPSNVMARKRLGSAHWALGDKTKAKSAWAAAAKIAPGDAELKKFLKLK